MCRPSHITANLDKTKVTGVSQVDAAQDKLHGAAASQLGRDGLAAPVGEFGSKQGVNRLERSGKDEHGRYIPGSNAAPGGKQVEAGIGAVADGGKKVGEGVTGGLSMLGGGKK